MTRSLSSFYLGGMAILCLVFSVYHLGWLPSDSSLALAAGWSFLSGAFAVGRFCFGIIADLKDRVKALQVRPVNTVVLLTDVFQSGESWYAPVHVNLETGAFSAPSSQTERILRKVVGRQENNRNVITPAFCEVVSEGQVRMFGQLYRRADAALG